MPVEECIRCGGEPGIDEQGYCAHCHWAVKVEVHDGFLDLRNYLAAWARFADWCAAHEAAG